MSGTEQGGDELRMKAILKQHGVGPDAPPPVPAEDWWAPKSDPFLDEDEDEDEPDDDAPARAGRFEPQPGYWPRPHTPAIVHRVRDRAPAALSDRTRAGLYNASAAGAGWGLGLYDQFAWALHDCGQSEGIGAGVVLGVVATLLIAHVWDRRTRHWWPGIAWAARIPLATAVLALALWAPAAH
ncbi:hypothetical protein [Streptomyces canus]|uniref:hypothetical protein n=1 Tax=Streptomyces canus TaxID=58343 RepID=UPI0003796B2A|nr:hypothetical protein [Streptomyces canus]